MIVNSLSRVQAAFIALPFFKRGLATVIEEWFDLLVYPENSLTNEQVPIQAGIAANGLAAVFLVQNQREGLVSQFTALMKANNYPEMENKLFQRALSQMPDGEVEVFLNVKNTGVDQGWTINGYFPLAKALEMLADGEVENKIKAWYDSFGADACVKVGRSVGGAYTIIHTELAGENAGEWLEYYLDAARAFGLDTFPNELLELIASDEPEALELIIHANKDGFLKFGFRLPQPSTRVQQAILLAFATDKSLGVIADFEGGLGAGAANFVDLYVDAAGFGVQFFYTPQA
jgi:hypothetical protein